MKPLSDQEIDDQLTNLRGWSRGDHCIEKTYAFKNFLRAMWFVNTVGYLAETRNHHPDILIHYNEVTLRNWTHAANAVTERDFDLAAAIDESIPIE